MTTSCALQVTLRARRERHRESRRRAPVSLHALTSRGCTGGCNPAASLPLFRAAKPHTDKIRRHAGLACATPQPCMRTKSAQTVIPMPFFPGLQGCSGLKGVCLPPDVLATLQPLGLLDRSEHRSVGSEGGDDVVHSRAEDVLLYKLSTSYRQVHVPGPGSRAGCETSMRSATVRGGSNPEGRVRAIFSLI